MSGNLEKRFMFLFYLLVFFPWFFFLAALGLRFCAWASSSGERSRSLVLVRELLLSAASLVAEHTLQARGLQELRNRDLTALRRVESSQTRDQTCAPSTGRWIPIYCTTRNVQTCSSVRLIFQELVSRNKITK